MRLTTRGRHAVAMLLHITLQECTGPIALSAVAAAEGIPLSFLEQIAMRLRQNGLLTSMRGPGGGYQLGREAEKITIAEILMAVEESMDATRCSGAHNCRDGRQCLTHDLWHELNEMISDFFTRTTLHTLKMQQTQKKSISTPLRITQP